MDIQRTSAIQQRRMRRIITGIAVVLVVAAVTVGLSRLKPAAPSVERSTLYIDKVKRGPMLRQVRGIGTLVPEEIRWIPALTEGRVEKINVRPGAEVKPETVLVELSNPQVQQAALDAEFQLKAAEAELNSQRVQLQSQVLSQKSESAKAATDYNEARMRAETDAELSKLGVISALNLKVSQGLAQQRKVQSEIEAQRLENAAKEVESRIAVQQAKVNQLRALSQLQQSNLEALKIKAGAKGVLQELSLNGQPLQIGQQVPAGTQLAKVAQPDKLKAELRIPETQVKEVHNGLPAQIDTRNGIVPGHVVRVDPAVQNGTVTVDVALDGALPQGARPDLSVDGTIDIERLNDVLYVGRPAFGQENSTVGMFRLSPDGNEAERVQVQMGRSSVNNVEIIGGLKEGDQVVLSDMSRWDNVDRIKLD